jgi:hypothetical protein
MRARAPLLPLQPNDKNIASQTKERAVMKQSIILLALAGSVLALTTMEASAMVCAHGVYHSGCVGYHGAVVVGRPIVHPGHRAVVVVPRGVVRRRVY